MPSPSKKTFLIVDGHALLHRAWHALPPLSTQDGTVVHGAYGFIMIMLNAIKKFSPEYVAVTFDLKGPTFRHKEFKEYKATREKKPDELYMQVPILERILEAMRIPVFTADGFEADDVIGTLSLLANKQDADVETIIATGDMDTLQLVDKRTKVFTLRKGFADTVVYDEAAVKERYQLKPTQIIDYKALRGDPSDNIPGVKGIGEKTATELLLTYGSVEAIYESLKKNDKKAKALKDSVREKLVEHEKEARQAKHLCTIKRDVPLKFKLSECAYAVVDRAAVEPIFKKYEFMKLLKQFPGGETPQPASGAATLFDVAPAAATASSANAITDVAGLDAALTKFSKSAIIAFRTVAENDNPVDPKIVALGLSDGKKTVLVRGNALASGRPLLSAFFAGKSQKVCHDLKREMEHLAPLGVEIVSPSLDLMIASYLLHSGERRHSLSAILGYNRSVSIEEEPKDTEAQVAQTEAALPYFPSLAEDFEADLKKNGLRKLYDEIDAPLVAVLAKMERTGIAVDKAYFEKLSVELGKKVDALTKKIHEMAGEKFNIASPAQMKVVLFDKMGISPLGLKRTSKGKTLSTAASELEKLRGASPIIDEILAYRELTKLKSTYVDTLPLQVHPKTGRIHAEFNQTVAATGRLSSANPNLQNIPTSETEYGKKVRNGFVAPKGRSLISADYSQFELRIAAHIAKEKVMIAAFKNGEDIHWRTAAEMFGEKEADKHRRIAKVINFGILYGMGPNRLAESANISFMEAREYIERYFALHKGIAKYMEDIKEKVVDDGYVETMFGRKRFFKNVRLMNPRERAEAERQATNMPIQGSQADMVKLTMIRLDEFIAKKYGAGENAQVKMVSQVHDELVFEVVDDEVDGFIKEMQPIMTETVKLIVPIVVNVSVGQRWGDMEKRA